MNILMHLFGQVKIVSEHKSVLKGYRSIEFTLQKDYFLMTLLHIHVNFIADFRLNSSFRSFMRLKTDMKH